MKTFFEINSDEFVAAALKVIEELNSPFNSHDFFEKFAAQNEATYIEWLYRAIDPDSDGQGTFEKIHQQIAKKLLHCSEKGLLPIRKNDKKVDDTNVFRNTNKVTEWEIK